MHADRPYLTLLLLGLAMAVQAQGVGTAGKDAKTSPAAAASPVVPDVTKPGNGKDEKNEPAAKDSATPGATTAPADGKATDTNAAADAAPSPAADTGLAGREGELVPQLPRLVGEEEVTWLEAEGQRFFVFKRAPKPGKKVRGTLVIVPAPQAFIDQRPLTRVLREDPLAGGYYTFALQPALAIEPAREAKDANGNGDSNPSGDAKDEPGKSAKEAAAPQAPLAAEAPETARSQHLCPRLTATIAAAGLVEPKSVALVAEQQHIPAVLACFADGFPPVVHALIAIGGWRGEWPRLSVPSLEFLPVLDPVARREAARRARTPPPRDAAPRTQVEIDGRLDDAAVEIARRLRGWLDRLPAPVKPKEENAKTVSG